MGLFSSIGNILNDITGASSAAEYNTKVSKEFAQNAHQWEVQDLKKAGLNPIISANGSTGASIAGKSGNMTQANTGITDLMNSAAGLAKTMSDMELQKSQEKLNNIETLNKGVQGNFIGDRQRAEIKNIISQSALNTAKTATEKGTTQNMLGTARNLIENKLK